MTMKIATQRDELSECWHQKMETLRTKPSFGFGSDSDYQAFCVAKDWIQDTSAVLMHHRSIGFSSNYLLSYLELYGILQALFVQQDAINALRMCFGLSEIPSKQNASPSWYALRQLRNKLVGHPVAKNLQRSVARYSLPREDRSYQDLSVFAFGDKPRQQKYNLGKMIDTYDEETAPKIQECLAELIKF